MAEEVNFDGIVGPTHNYSGLSYGNIASMNHQEMASNPREAALQGLHKMHALMKMGLKQAVLPPHERPYLPVLFALGFQGSADQVLQQVPHDLLIACSSAAAMWTANAATVCPSADSTDRRVHLTPANLTNKFHRSLEPATTERALKAIFSDPRHFIVHDPLPAGNYFSDEGAANHTRFCNNYGDAGIQLFVFGRYAIQKGRLEPKLFPARQTLEASAALCRLHQLNPDQVIFAQQNPEAIDAGAFHNDVISVGNRQFFFCHEKAFVDTPATLHELKEKFRRHCQGELTILEVKETEISLQESVVSYLFNSQLVSLPDGTMTLIAPTECEALPAVRQYLAKHFAKIHYFDLRQSMCNGGGPACLRLRVVLSEEELAAMNPEVLLTEDKYRILCDWVKRHYRERLVPAELRDPKLLEEGCRALDELTKILNLGNIYDFQRDRGVTREQD